MSVKTQILLMKNIHNMRKPTSELKTAVVPLDVYKVSNIQTLKEQAEKWWNIKRIQTLFPCMEELFKIENIRTPYNYGLKTQNNIQTISGPSSIYTCGNQQEIHKKVTMILPSYKIMKGDFGSSGLPCDKENSEDEYKLIHSIHNAAYVGSLANVMLSQSKCIHFPEVYGTFTGIASKHTIDISDDYEDLSERPWFVQNLGHFFDLKLRNTEDKPVLAFESSMELDSDIDIGAVELNACENVPEITDLPPIEQKNTEDDSTSYFSEGSEESKFSTDYIFGIHTCSTDDNGVGEGVGFEDDDDSEIFAEAIFKDVPVQVTVMEKCESTLYDLFKKNPENEKRIAWIIQVMFGLSYAQRYYSFVHNDLHINNIMYVSTNKEFLYYSLNGKQYKVPTFGYIIKIIDFDRATFAIKLVGMREPRFFMSNHFDHMEEAGGQYNVLPFYNQKVQEIKPNPSFDLVRLATSIFWDCFPQGPLAESYKDDALFGILMNWMTLPDGSSIMFRDLTKDDVHERYRGFHLYKAIARYCKGTAIPRQQIEKYATQYVVTEKLPLNTDILLIDN